MRFSVHRPGDFHPCAFARSHGNIDVARNPLRHLILKRQNVLIVALVASCPQVTIPVHPDELSGDPDALPGAEHSPFDDVSGPQLARNLAQLGFGFFESLRGGA